jgi:drug/metabolite transporter (DMT)-like permease
MLYHSSLIRGAIYILLSATFYATLPIFGKLAYQAGLQPAGILILRYLFALGLLFVYIKLIQRRSLFNLSLPVVIQGVVMTVASLLYFMALKYLSAGMTTVIFFSHPILVATLAIIIYKERFSPRLFLGLVLAMGGIVLVSGYSLGWQWGSATGLIYALSACVCYALYGLLGQKALSQGEPLSVAATLSLIAVIALSLFSCRDLDFIVNLTSQQLIISFGMAVINTLLAMLFFLKGIKEIGASRATLISTAEPPLCIIMAFLILGETLTVAQIIGASLVFISMLLATLPALQHAPAINNQSETHED